MARRSIAGLRFLVTGASSGIGRALVEGLIAAEGEVVAMARRQDRLAQLAGELEADEALHFVVGDVTNPSDRERALRTCERELGGLDVLVNNAGSGVFGTFASHSAEELRRVFEINFFAPAELVREALPLLRAGRTPMVVNVGSVLGHRAVPNKSEYCASKFALHGLTDALRAELSKEKIDVLLVSPSTTSSEFFQQASGSPDHAPEKIRGMSPQAVARRIIRAIRGGRHEIILSAGGRTLVWIDRLCPPLADWLVARFF